MPEAIRDLGNDYHRSACPSLTLSSTVSIYRPVTERRRPTSTTTIANQTAEQRFVLYSVGERDPTVLVVQELPGTAISTGRFNSYSLQQRKTGRKSDRAKTRILYIFILKNTDYYNF